MRTFNKKIRNATSKNYKGISFKSQLEVTVFKVFDEAGFNPMYEPLTTTIVSGFIPKTSFYTRDKSTNLLKIDSTKIKGITYTPDIIFDYSGIRIFIEVKGFENDVFPVKKKLFRKWLDLQPYTSLYFEIWSKKQALQAVDIIKTYKPISMSIIDSISSKLSCLPTKKDIMLASKFLEKRDFVSLKEIVDSDIIKLRNKITDLTISNQDGIYDSKYEELNDNYNALQELQGLINPIAADFLDPLVNNDEDSDINSIDNEYL